MADGTRRSKTWRIIPFLLIVLVMLIGGGIALAGVPTGVPTGAGAAPPVQAKPVVYDDGFDALPWGLKGLSYSTLAMAGKVHPLTGQVQSFSWKSPFAPLLNITWGADNQTTTTNS